MNIFIAASITKSIIEDRIISFIQYFGRRENNKGIICENKSRLVKPFLRSYALS